MREPNHDCSAHAAIELFRLVRNATARRDHGVGMSACLHRVDNSPEIDMGAAVRMDCESIVTGCSW